MVLPRLHLCVAVLWAGISVCSVTAYQDYDNVERQPDYNDVLGNTLNPMHCFQCNSRQDPDCINIQANDTDNYHYKPCLDTELYKDNLPFCRKIIQRIYERDNMEIVIRKCGWIRHPRLDCYNVKNDDHEEVICQCFSSGCNGSSGLFSSMVVVVLSQIAYLTLGKK